MDEIDIKAPEFSGFFEAARQGALAFPRCGDCGRFHWYPMKACPHCRSRQIGWQKVEGTGTVFSWTVVRHAFDPAYKDRLPYIIALLEFDDAPGIRLVTNIEAAPEEVAIGDRMWPHFHASGKVTFQPAAA